MKKFIITAIFILITLASFAPDTLEKGQRYSWPTVREIEIEKVETYLLTFFPTTPLKAEWVVDYGNKYGISPQFILTIGQIETQFATDPTAIRCLRNKTMFSVGEFDDGTSLFQNKSYEQSVERFCKLISKDYLVKGKTEYDLLRNFRNKWGYRYATAPLYEVVITFQYHYIKDFLDNI